MKEVGNEVTPLFVTMIAEPVVPPNMVAKADAYMEGVRAQLETRDPEHLLQKVSSVLDISLALGRLIEANPGRQISLQLVGHGLSGHLFLAAGWNHDPQVNERAYQDPYYVMTTDPKALGLLYQHAGHLSEVTVVACNVAADFSYGYPVNGRTLMFTLAEILQCQVTGASDVVGLEEFDRAGFYAPLPERKKPCGWRWRAGQPPLWIEGRVAEPSEPPALNDAWRTFVVTAVLGAQAPIPKGTFPRKLPPSQKLHGQLVKPSSLLDSLAAQLPEVSLQVQSDAGEQEAQLLSRGQYLRVGGGHYALSPDQSVVRDIWKLLWTAPSQDAADKRAGDLNSVGDLKRSPGRLRMGA